MLVLSCGQAGSNCAIRMEDAATVSEAYLQELLDHLRHRRLTLPQPAAVMGASVAGNRVLGGALGRAAAHQLQQGLDANIELVEALVDLLQAKLNSREAPDAAMPPETPPRQPAQEDDRVIHVDRSKNKIGSHHVSGLDLARLRASVAPDSPTASGPEN
jgi:hypothetical protein